MASWIPLLVTWLVVALAHLLLPAALLRRRPGERRARLLTALYSGLVAVWGLSGALTALAEPAPEIAASAALVVSGLAPAVAGLVIVLECAFVGQDGGGLWGIAGSLWTVLALAVGQYSRHTGNVPWASETMAIFGWGTLWVVLSVVWVRQYARTQWAFRRNRLLYWMGAGASLLVGQALVLFATGYTRSVGLLLDLVGLTAIAIAVTRFRLPNVRAALRQVLSFVVLAVLTALLLLLGLLALAPTLRIQPLPPSAIGLAITIAIVLAIAYQPLQSLVVRMADRLIPRNGYDLAQTLHEYTLAIGNIIDLEQLATVAVGTLSEVLEVRRGTLILVTEVGRQFRLQPMQGMGNIPHEEITFDFQSPVVKHLREEQQPLFQHDLEHDPAFQDLPPREQKWLQEMGMEIHVPILVQSLFLGILAVGPPRSGEPFGQREQAFLTTMAQQTAVALQNARMFEDMRELNLDIIQLNEDLRRAKERMERLDQAKTDFLTIASHELRTPLTQVKGYSDVLAELSAARSISMEQVDEITCSISRAADRLEAIVKAMLDMSQIEVDALALLLVTTTLKSVMRIALEPWMEPIQLRQLHLVVEGVDDIPPIVADLQRLSQVFDNLISNAIKYTPDGGTISIRARQTNNACFKVVVADTGMGIDPLDHELVFDKFFRACSPDHHSSGIFKFKGGGPGLGLSIARGVVEAHNGRIWVVSEGYDEERCPGSAFHVVLPLRAGTPLSEALATEKVMPFITG